MGVPVCLIRWLSAKTNLSTCIRLHVRCFDPHYHLFDVFTACTAENAHDLGKFYCSVDENCITLGWKCDGTADCVNGEDETPETCSAGKWFEQVVVVTFCTYLILLPLPSLFHHFVMFVRFPVRSLNRNVCVLRSQFS